MDEHGLELIREYAECELETPGAMPHVKRHARFELELLDEIERLKERVGNALFSLQVLVSPDDKKGAIYELEAALSEGMPKGSRIASVDEDQGGPPTN